MFAEILDADIEEQFAYFERLNKSADPQTRERAQTELDRLATVDLEKVGPKGYIHGWIFVGAPGVGDRVYHPHHGHGTITRHGKRTVGVRFDSGKEHAFEHGVRRERIGETSGHFGQRLDGRTGKPVGAHKPIEAGTGHAKPGLPRAEHAKRGDLVIVSRPHDGIVQHHVGRVTNVTQDGKVTAWQPAHRPEQRGPVQVGTLDRVTHVVPKDRIDVEGALAAERQNGHPRGYFSRQELAASLHPHVRPEGHAEGAKKPEVKPGGDSISQHVKAPVSMDIFEGGRSGQLDVHGVVTPDGEGVIDIRRGNDGRGWVADLPNDGGSITARNPQDLARRVADHYGVSGRVSIQDDDGKHTAAFDHVAKPKTESKPKAPKAPKERAPGEARRGDIVLVHEKRLEGTRDGRGRTVHSLHVAQVTAVSRDGKVKEYKHADAGPNARPYQVKHDKPNTEYHIIPQEKIDTEAALATYRDRKWTPGGISSKPYESLAEAREAMKPHLRETPEPPKVEEPKKPEVYKPKPGGDLDLHTENSARDHLAAGRTPETMEAHATRLEAQAAEHRAAGRMTEAADASGRAERFRMTAQRMREISESKPEVPKHPGPVKPPEPERPMRSAREEVKDARGERMIGEPEHPRGPATDYAVRQHPAVKRAEQAVYRSANGYDGTPTPAAVKQLHDAYRTAGAERADRAMRDTWGNLDRSQQRAAITDPEFGETVRAHLAAVHRAARVRNDPAASAEAKKAADEAADRAHYAVHGVSAISARREREDARRAAVRARINGGDSSAAVDLLPPKADDRITRLIADATTPRVDSSLTGKRLQTATAVRNAEVEVKRARLTEDAIRHRVESRRSINPAWDGHEGVKAALDAEHRRNANEWQRASKEHEQAQLRLIEARHAMESAEAEHKVAVGKQQAEVSRQMREEFDKLPALPKSTEGKDIAKEAGVPRTITRLTGRERELAREVNKRADYLSERADKANAFNRQADIVERTHAKLSGTLHPEVQDNLDGLLDRARAGRGEGDKSVYRENLDDAINRWNDFQRAKNGVAPRDEREMEDREHTARLIERDEPELAARIRAGNKLGGAATESEVQHVTPKNIYPLTQTGTVEMQDRSGNWRTLHPKKGVTMVPGQGFRAGQYSFYDDQGGHVLEAAGNERLAIRHTPHAPRAVESEEADSTLPIADLPKPRAPRTREYKEPVDLEPGAKVSWTHHHEDGSTTRRTGRVWSKAPKEKENRDAAWVTPDESLPTDRYSAIVVHPNRVRRKGEPLPELHSYDSDKTHSGSLAIAAARHAERVRTTGKSFHPLVDPLIEAAIEHTLSAA